MPYINFSEDDLYRANTADLVSYLEHRGERVKRVGSTYKYIYTDGSGTHDSVTIHGGKWYDHKNQHGGYAVKFLQEFLGFSFQDSVIELLGGHCSAQTQNRVYREPPKPVVKPFELPEPNSDMRRVFAYLTKQRFLFFTRFMPTNGFAQPFVGIISFLSVFHVRSLPKRFSCISRKTGRS